MLDLSSPRVLACWAGLGCICPSPTINSHWGGRGGCPWPPQPQPRVTQDTCPGTCKSTRACVHTRACTHMLTEGKGLYRSRGLCQALTQANAGTIWAGLGEPLFLLSVCGWERGQEGPRWADGVKPLGHPAASRGWRLSWAGASGATELCKQEAQPRPAWLEILTLSRWNPLLSSDLPRAGGQAQGSGMRWLREKCRGSLERSRCTQNATAPTVDTSGCERHPTHWKCSQCAWNF